MGAAFDEFAPNVSRANLCLAQLSKNDAAFSGMKAGLR
jgi:hypothetical protein